MILIDTRLLEPLHAGQLPDHVGRLADEPSGQDRAVCCHDGRPEVGGLSHLSGEVDQIEQGVPADGQPAFVPERLGPKGS